MYLPDTLVAQVQTGNVVLLLGAGATIGATNSVGEVPLSADGLRDALSDEFPRACCSLIQFFPRTLLREEGSSIEKVNTQSSRPAAA